MLAQIGKFGLVGILNTLIDFAIFNFLSSKRVGLSKIRANLVSTTVAMIFSFFANQRFVFQSQGGNFWQQAISFYLVTAFGLYVLQNVVIWLVTKKMAWLQSLILSVAGLFGLRKRLSDDFIIKNCAKLAATVVSLTWNFVMFKKVVFKT